MSDTIFVGMLVLWLASAPAAGSPTVETPQPVTPEPAAQAMVTTDEVRSLRERLGQLVSADFQEVDFAAAIAFLSDHAGVNIILSEKARELGRPVTVHLVEMPLGRALEHLLRGQGLLFRVDEEAIWVATRDEIEAEPMETRIFFLNQGPGLVAAFEPISGTRESVALKPAGIREMRTFKDIVEEVIPKVGESTIMLDERTGALIVTHVPYYLQQIEELLTQLDIVPAQVLIEARFVEVTFTDTKEWGFDAQLTGDASLTRKRGKDDTQGAGLQLSQTGSTLARGSKVNFTDFTNQTSGNALNLTFQGILTGTQYSAVLHALAQNQKTKTLSAPRVTTLNNQTATIKVVTEFVYATRYEASVVREDLNSDGDFNDVSSAGTRETRFVNVPQGFVTKDLGILLHVTPSVGKDMRTVTLALKPEVSEKKTDDSFGGEVSLPRFTARQLETSVVIQDGDTVMLGGLMKDTTTKTVTKVPLLGSLPIIGPLFRKDDDSAERSNLLIFVTANLLHPSGARIVKEPATDF